MKKYISFFLALILVTTTCFGNIPTVSAADSDYFYTVTDGKATITKYKGSASTLVVPSTLGGYPVTEIGYSAFYYCTGLVAINVPSGVTSIGDKAFQGCSKLNTVTLPDTLKTIGEQAFYYCEKLTNITIPSGVTVINKLTFARCSSLSTLVLHDKITSIEPSAFSNCIKLTSISIPASVTSFSPTAFIYCSELTEINVDSNNPNYCSDNGIVFNKDKSTLVSYPSGKTDTSYVVPATLKYVGPHAFSQNKKLTSVQLPDGLISIGDSAFHSTNLASINLPDTITTIGNNAFYFCSKLDNITLPKNLKTLGESAFCQCSNLKTITFSDGITSIGKYAFGSTAWLNNQLDEFIYINKILYKYKGNAPAGTIIDNIKPDTIDIIDNAFSNTDNIVRIDIPASVQNIGNDAIAHSGSGLTAINVDAGNANYCSVDGVLFSKDKTEILFYPPKKSDTSYTIPSSVTDIVIYCFYDSKNLTTIVMPDNLKTIGDYAFDRCENLNNIIIPDSVTSIGADAFVGCNNLNNIIIPDSVTSIGKEAFSYCDNLNNITIPASVTSIDGYILSMDDKLSAIYLDKDSYAESYINEKYSSLVQFIKYRPTMSINQSAVSLIAGETYSLSASIVTNDDSIDKTIKWSTSDSSVATVDQSGNVTAVKAGTAKITATSAFKIVSCDVKVNGTVSSLYNPENKVTVDTVGDSKISSDTTLKVNKIDASASDKSAVQIIANGKDVIAMYDISLLLNGSAVQPNGKIKITLTLTDEQLKNFADFKVVYIDNSGKASLIDCTRDGNKISFVTDHLSKYGIIGTTTSSLPNSNQSNTNTGTVPNPQTNSESHFILWASLMLICVGSVFTAKKLKEKHSN